MSSSEFPSARWSLRLAWAFWAGLVACAVTMPANAQTVWELTPYRIQVILAAGAAPELTPDFQADLARDLLARADALVGAAWDLGVAEAPAALRYALLRDVKTVTVELVEAQLAAQGEAGSQSDGISGFRGRGFTSGHEIPKSPNPQIPESQSVGTSSETQEQPEETRLELSQLDKVILLVVLPEPTGYRVVARELDVRTRQWNTPVSVLVGHVAKLRDAAFDAVWEAFSPLAEIVGVEKDVVTLRLRAAGFPARDKTLVTVRPGDLFRPVIRHNDRYGNLRGVNPIPWTFLTVDKVAAAGLTCTLHTGLRTPLSARRRGRFEQLALGLAPPGKSTRVTLRSRTDPDQVLPGYDVYSHAPGSKKTELVGRTDRQGSVVVGPGEHPLRVLIVKHGSEFLARLPIVPGSEAELAAEIANDDQRLQAEGFISGLRQDLIDLVIRREVLLAQAGTRLDERKYDEVEKLLHELRSLESRDDFALALMQEQKKVFSADMLIQAKIDQMFSKTRKLVDQYLDPAVIDQLERELSEARAAGRKALL